MKIKSLLFGMGVAAAASLSGARAAHAHFLWMEMPGQAPASVRVTFGEDAKDPTTPDLLKKIEKARAWSADGKALNLKPVDGALTTGVPDVKLIGAEQTWGILDRSGQGRGVFLLNYYAKTAKDAESASQSAKLPVEVFAKTEGGLCSLTVQQGGKPAPGAEIWAMAPGSREPLTLKTDDSGEARFALAGSGDVQVRAMVADMKSGKWEDKPYELVRNYSTLTFPVNEEKSGPNELLSAALSLRETWPKGFPGFTAQLHMDKNGETADGALKVAANGEVELKFEDPDMTKDAKETFQSLVMHRISRSATRYNPAFGPEDHHPQGRAILLNDSFNSMYRVRNGQLMQVNRDGGEGGRFSIDILHNLILDDGKYLPSSFTVSYRDKAGKLTKVESFSEKYENIGGFWLPVERQEVDSKDNATSVTHYKVSNLQLNTLAKTEEE